MNVEGSGTDPRLVLATTLKVGSRLTVLVPNISPGDVGLRNAGPRFCGRSRLSRSGGAPPLGSGARVATLHRMAITAPPRGQASRQNHSGKRCSP